MNDRAALIMVDYARRARLKIYGHMEVVPLDADPALATLAIDRAGRAKPERILKLRLDAFDWNCPQHITPALHRSGDRPGLQPLHERLSVLEAENAALRAGLVKQQD